MKIERDKFYKMRDGKVVRVVALDAPSLDGHPVLTVDASGNIFRLTTEGKEFTEKELGELMYSYGADDLVAEYREPRVIYVNEYPNGATYAYSSREAAVANRNPAREARMGVKYIEVIDEGK